MYSLNGADVTEPFRHNFASQSKQTGNFGLK